MTEITKADLQKRVPANKKPTPVLNMAQSIEGMASGENTRMAKCATHGKYVSSKLPTGGWSGCGRCMAEEVRQEDMAKQIAERQDARARAGQANLDKLRISAQIPRRFQNRTLESYQVESPPQGQAVKLCQRYVQKFQDRFDNGGGLVFSGRPGTGKTHLACGIGNALITMGWRVLFTPVYDLLDAVKEAAFDLKECSEREAIRRFTKMDLLILDELGAEKGSDWDRQTLFKVINNRYNEGLPTIILTNLTVDEFKEFVGDRIHDRMKEGSGAFVSFNWSSYRENIRTIAGAA